MTADKLIETVERDPRFASFTDERTWLLAREHELVAETESVDRDAEQDAYDAAESEGFDQEYCEEQAAKIATRRKEIKKAKHEIRARMTLISPSVKKETNPTQSPGVKQMRFEKSREEQGRHFAIQERIATAYERMAAALEKIAAASSPRKRRKVTQ